MLIQGHDVCTRKNYYAGLVSTHPLSVVFLALVVQGLIQGHDVCTRKNYYAGLVSTHPLSVVFLALVGAEIEIIATLRVCGSLMNVNTKTLTDS